MYRREQEITNIIDALKDCPPVTKKFVTGKEIEILSTERNIKMFEDGLEKGSSTNMIIRKIEQEGDVNIISE